jgi:two-component system, NarL family, sensor kinase
VADKLKVYTRTIFSYTPIKINFIETIENDSDLNPAFALHLFRICQEAINNVFKHAHASVLDIGFNRRHKIEITISDNGIGFDTALNKGNYGLENLKARADEIKADLQVQSKLDKGTQIRIIV